MTWHAHAFEYQVIHNDKGYVMSSYYTVEWVDIDLLHVYVKIYTV